MGNILVTGGTGQIGTELIPYLRARFGSERVVATGHRKKPAPAILAAGPFAALDVRDRVALAATVARHDVDTIYHLAGVLSAVGEANPQLAWD
ncbi:MAG: NAD-dependent epimerase/dehydratase family protein, partial [Desulfobulbaceae bacterium]|nr:NAD-dependent epimerase/dehydratase family protein [Desulfobulbaceae bacterium]